MHHKIRNEHGCFVEHFADTRRKARFRLFGHVLRASPADSLVQVTFLSDGLTPRAPTRRRPGRPKEDWTTEGYKDAYRILHGVTILVYVYSCFLHSHKPVGIPSSLDRNTYTYLYIYIYLSLSLSLSLSFSTYVLCMSRKLAL